MLTKSSAIISVFGIIFLALLAEIYSYPYEAALCYDRACPVGTSACKKIEKSHPADKSTLAITVACLDEQDMVLKEYHSSDYNPRRSYSTHYESISYASVDNPNSAKLRIPNNDVEQFGPYRQSRW